MQFACQITKLHLLAIYCITDRMAVSGTVYQRPYMATKCHLVLYSQFYLRNCAYFNGTSRSSDYTALDDKIINELKTLRKEAVVA